MPLTEWTKRQLAERPLEARVLRKLYHVLGTAGEAPIKSWDGEQSESVASLDDYLNVAFNLDWVQFETRTGWIRIIFGNDPDELLADYTVNLEDILQSFYDWLDKHFGGN